MPDSRLERTRKLYSELNLKLPDTTKPSWWTEEYDSALAPSSGITFDHFWRGPVEDRGRVKINVIPRGKIDPNA